jgi:hypothetical protein
MVKGNDTVSTRIRIEPYISTTNTVIKDIYNGHTDSNVKGRGVVDRMKH